MAGISTTTFYRHRNGDPDFAAAVQQAEVDGTQFLEDEARRRGVDGVQEPVVHGGKLSYHTDPRTGELILDQSGNPIPLTTTKYSDNLLMFTLKARDRSRFADRHEVTGPDGGPIESADVTNVAGALRQRLGGMLNRVTIEETVTVKRKLTVDR